MVKIGQANKVRVSNHYDPDQFMDIGRRTTILRLILTE
jgi:hypothetical protein